MELKTNVIIGDESALFFYLHCDVPANLGVRPAYRNPFDRCARTAAELNTFNRNHPLYGSKPVVLLAPDQASRRRTKAIEVRACNSHVGSGSFLQLKEGLFITSPEFTYVRLAGFLKESQLVEAATNLCGRFYLNLDTGRIDDRSQYLTTVEKLSTYCESLGTYRGAKKAKRALAYVLENSGSPAESKMMIQYRHPLSKGGLALPFDEMNYDVSADRRLGCIGSSEYCIDMVNTAARIGVEYDGEEYHRNASKDKKRRNELLARGWKIFPIDKSVLYDSFETEKFGYEIAKAMKVRIRKPQDWDERYMRLREELSLSDPLFM